MDSWLGELFLVTVLIGLNAVFAASEIALLSVRRSRMATLAQQGSKAAEAVLRMTDQTEKLLATIQIGITLAGMLASATAAVGMAEALAFILARLPVPGIRASSHAIAVFLVTLVISYVTLVVGELVPKRVALQHSERISLWMARPLEMLSRLASPFVWLLTVSTQAVLWVLGIRGKLEDETVSEAEILQMVAVHEEIPPEEKLWVRNVFEFGDACAREVMVHRSDTLVLSKDLDLKEAARAMHEAGLSWAPVFDSSSDDIVGQVSLSDIVGRCLETDGKGTVREIMQPVRVVPELKPLGDLLTEMRDANEHLVVVADEYGSLVGVVSVNDLLEKLLADPHSLGDLGMAAGSTEYLIPGNAPVRAVNKALGLTIPESEDYVTLAGFLMDRLGHIPLVGEQVQHEDAVLTVERVRHHRVEQIRISRRPRSKPEAT
ncbi:MAG: HlyC/CorC family transporter [Firmicutes bacterium]|jgi:putative hemolysin|nr:HlyC/CorC family transporter [Bacillota bacterium]